MPLPMVHMTITERIFRQRGLEPDPAFLLGSISPDAIHMRENTTRADKRRTHFDIDEKYTVEGSFHSKMGRFVDLLPGDRQWRMFAKGYIAHVLTDLIWSHTIYRDFERETENQQSEGVRALYYREIDQIDFLLYRSEEWRTRAWDALRNCSPMPVKDMLTEMEVEKWKHRVLDWYTDTSKEPRIEPRYITEESVHRFIDEATVRLYRLFEREGYL